MPLDITSCFTEESIIESMLPPPEQLSIMGPRRHRFYQDVFADVLVQSSVLLFFLGYRKGEHPQYSLISCGMTYLVFWASTRYSTRTKIDLSYFKDRYFFGAFVALNSGLFLIFLSVQLRADLLVLVAFGAVILSFLIVFILMLAKFTQNLFRSEPTALESVQMPVFSLLVYMAFIFIYIHNSLYFWHRLVKQGLSFDLPIVELLMRSGSGLPTSSITKLD